MSKSNRILISFLLRYINSIFSAVNTDSLNNLYSLISSQSISSIGLSVMHVKLNEDLQYFLREFRNLITYSGPYLLPHLKV